MMTIQEFIDSSEFPSSLSQELHALWEDAEGDWDTAHRIVQHMSTSDAMWVHAYLHRKEGDLANSSYWYSRTRHNMPDMPLDEEWRVIATELLTKGE
ncbi:MAG: hypothetical protein GY801_27495 [bacterium]|nr:hypothetical protein [bacterium]